MLTLSIPLAENLNSFVVAWLGVVLFLSAGYDIYQRRIPNFLVLVGLGGLWLIQAWQQTWEPVSLLIGLVLGLTLWQLKLIGGGDSKLLVLVSATFAPTYLPALYVCISLAGAAQALVALALKQDKKLPYAVAIFLGTLAFTVLGFLIN